MRQFLLRNQIREHAAADHRDHRTEKGTGQGNKYGQQNPVVPEYFLVAFQGKIGGKDKEPSFRLLGIAERAGKQAVKRINTYKQYDEHKKDIYIIKKRVSFFHGFSLLKPGRIRYA